MKYVGLVFDSKHDGNSHLQHLKSKCIKTLNIMQSVSSIELGADRKTLMMIYISFIRFKKAYGCRVDNSASSRELASLESVSNETVRASSECSKSMLTSSLQVLTEDFHSR